MARDMRLNVDGDSRGGQRALEEVAAASATAAHEADRMAAQFRQAQNDAAKLDRQLAETAIATRALAREFAKTNDSAIKAQLDAEKKRGTELKNLRKDIIGDTEAAARATTRFAESAARDLEKAQKQAEATAFSFSQLVPDLGAAGPGLAAIGAVPALAAAGGATAALAGAGAAGIGVAGAVLGDPKAFEASWGAALDSVKKDFFDATAPFTGVTLDAIKTIGPTIDSWHLGAALAPAVHFVPQLVSGVEGFATGIERGAAVLIGKAGPAVTALSAGLVKLGDAGGDALSSIADGADGGAAALADTLTAASALVVGFGKVTEAAEKAYGFVQDHPFIAAGATGGLSIGASIWANALGNADEAGAHFGATLKGVTLTGNLAADAAAKQAADYAALAQGLKAATVDANTLAGSMSDKVFSALLAGDHATLSWHESLTSLGAALKDNGRSIDITTEAGQRNREAVLSAVQANIQQYDTLIAAHAGADVAARSYDANTQALEKQLRAARFTQGQIDSLIGTYAAVPDSTNTDINVYGLENAINDLDDTIARLGHIDGYHAHAKVTVDTEYIGNRQSTYDQQVPKFKAAGGWTSGLTMVGEKGPELLELPAATFVHDHTSTTKILAGMAARHLPTVPRMPAGLFGSGSGSSGGTRPVNLVYDGPTGGLDGLFASWLMKMSRTGDLRIHESAIVGS